MSAAATYTTTYTQSDIEAVFRNLLGELYMVVDSTGLRGAQWAIDVAYDLTVLAARDLVASVHVVLDDAIGREIRANVYMPSADATSWTPQRPACIWPRTPTGSLNVVVHHTLRWTRLDQVARAQLANVLKLTWSVSNRSLDHAGLRAGEERTFVSNAYGVRRVAYS